MPEKYFYARLKPYNPRLGYMLKGMFVPEPRAGRRRWRRRR